MKKHNYDFSRFDVAMSHLKQRQDTATLNEIKNELNRFFTEAECVDVIFTKNFNNVFFGMTTFCILTKNEVNNIILGEKEVRIAKYIIEIDSKLLEIGLNNREMSAVLLHEVGHVVNDSTPAKEVRKALDIYMKELHTTISIDDAYKYSDVLKFGIQDTIRKVTSIFTRKDAEILADEFVFLCGYGTELDSAFKKICYSGSTVNKNTSSKLIALDWTLRAYKNLRLYRSIALKILNSSKPYTGSVLEKREMDEAIKALKYIDIMPSHESGRLCKENGIGEIVVENATIQEAEDVKPQNGGFIGRLRKKGIRGIEEDLFEYRMRIRNVETADEAINLMRQINSRMAILDDYLNNCGEIPEPEYLRVENCLNKYDELREDLSKKAIYNKKNYGLWFDMNYVDTNR